MSGKGKSFSFAKWIGDSRLKSVNKKLKPGEAPATIDTLYAKDPDFLAAYKRGAGQSLGSAGNPSSVTPNASVASSTALDLVRKRLAAQLGGSTILGANSDALGG
jgi:hypothetical protein